MTGRWDFISVHRADFGVQGICRVLGVSRPGCYRWAAGASARAEPGADDDALVEEIREIHADTVAPMECGACTPSCGAPGTRSTASGSSV
jgi:hypothetical protein